jgi:16S rRNA (cytidine1402-2'-O)-methyltransferase
VNHDGTKLRVFLRVFVPSWLNGSCLRKPKEFDKRDFTKKNALGFTYNPRCHPRLPRMSSLGTLFIVATPLGHPQDITLRAVEVLRQVAAVVCEERREGARLLKKLGLDKPLVMLNEHTEAVATPELVARLQAGDDLALISDCGTPVFSDPGHALVRAATHAGARVSPMPGPSSLMAALSVCDFKVERFVYEGFLPRDKAQRHQRLVELRAQQHPIVLMDTPYRLGQLLGEIAEVFGPAQPVMLATDLTLPTEYIWRGPVAQVAHLAGGEKREFVLVIKPGYEDAKRKPRKASLKE